MVEKLYHNIERVTYKKLCDDLLNRHSIGHDTKAAHIHPETHFKQSVSEHNIGTAVRGSSRCSVEGMYHIILLAGIFHDAGKYCAAYQNYLHKALEDKELVRRGEVNHSTGGGLLVEKCIPKTVLSEMLQIAIYSHHGLKDCIDLKSGQYLVDRRNSKPYQEEYGLDAEELEKIFYTYMDRKKLDELFSIALEEVETIKGSIVMFMRGLDSAKMYGSAYFYIGMYERLLMSSLIDGDRLDTASFMRGKKAGEEIAVQKLSTFWENSILYYENYMYRQRETWAGTKNQINQYRQEIAESCKAMAVKKNRLYRLTVPTGSGKTLSSLRYALYHARKYEKKRIIYVAPYLSILDQNADEIRKAIGNENAVLEHHCNVLHETEEERRRYEQLVENWDSPIIVTTAVQLLNTLFSAKTSSVRRMNSLADSIIIWDEIQSMPPRITGLFNLAVNFLTEFCNSTIILCSATQPVLDELPESRMLTPVNMIADIEHYDTVFRRTNLVNKTKMSPSGLSVEELGQFTLECFEKEGQVLAIVNTKACAKHLYEYLKNSEIKIKNLYHLSTNMCVLNRRDTLAKIRGLMEKREPVICISTKLIEAGVDISCKCVIRSLAGLDSIIQAAGRCNRHGEKKEGRGNVYIVRMNHEAEHISSMPELKVAQESMSDLLYIKNDKVTQDCNYLFSEEAKQIYYRLYYKTLIKVVNYPVTTTEGIQSTLVELLSGNQPGRRQYKEKNTHFFHQAFKTAGELFEVIPEDGKFDVVVMYNQEIKERIEELQGLQYDYQRQREIIKELQLATVSISEQLRNKLGRAIYPICNGLIYVLSEGYYSNETGISENPIHMNLLYKFSELASDGSDAD